MLGNPSLSTEQVLAWAARTRDAFDAGTEKVEAAGAGDKLEAAGAGQMS